MGKVYITTRNLERTPSLAGILQHFSNANVHTNHSGSLVNAASDSVGLGWGLGICISNKFSDDADIPGPRTYIEYQWFRTISSNLLLFPFFSVVLKRLSLFNLL